MGMTLRPVGAMGLALMLAVLACGGGAPATTPPPTRLAPTLAPTSPGSPTDAVAEVATLPPPLEDVEFPTGPAEYPTDWPEALEFPEGFVLADAAGGSLPDATVEGWSAKLRYAGDSSSAAAAVGAFLGVEGWGVVEQTDLDSGGILLLLETSSGGTGIIVIDVVPSQPGFSLVEVTLFP